MEEWKDSQVGEEYNVNTKENKVVGTRDSANSCRARHSPGYSPEERNSFLGSRLGTVIVLGSEARRMTGEGTVWEGEASTSKELWNVTLALLSGQCAY